MCPKRILNVLLVFISQYYGTVYIPHKNIEIITVSLCFVVYTALGENMILPSYLVLLYSVSTIYSSTYYNKLTSFGENTLILYDNNCHSFRAYYLNLLTVFLHRVIEVYKFMGVYCNKYTVTHCQLQIYCIIVERIQYLLIHFSPSLKQ